MTGTKSPIFWTQSVGRPTCQGEHVMHQLLGHFRPGINNSIQQTTYQNDIWQLVRHNQNQFGSGQLQGKVDGKRLIRCTDCHVARSCPETSTGAQSLRSKVFGNVFPQNRTAAGSQRRKQNSLECTQLPAYLCACENARNHESAKLSCANDSGKWLVSKCLAWHCCT